MNDSADSLSCSSSRKPARWENQTPIYLIAWTDTLTHDRRQTRLTTNQPASQSDSTKLKAGKLYSTAMWQRLLVLNYGFVTEIPLWGKNEAN